jgi:hypothetical protein
MQNNFNYDPKLLAEADEQAKELKMMTDLDKKSEMTFILVTGFNRLTIQELKNFCKDKGIYIKSDMKKHQIINILINILVNKE